MRRIYIRPAVARNLIGLVIFVGGALSLLRGASAAGSATRTVPGTQPAFDVALTVPGTLEGRRVEIRPEMDGAVRDVNFREGQAVKRGEMLIQLEDGVARAQVDAAKAEYELADERARNLENAPKGTFSPSERKNVLAQRRVAAATLVTRLAALEQTRLVAPMDGVISRGDAMPGMVASRGVSLATIVQLQPLAARCSISKRGYEDTRLGQEVGIFDPITHERLAAATISFISPEFDPSTATATVKADLDNPGGKLKPGMNVLVQFPR